MLLTRPVLRADVSELSPVLDWALRDWLSPFDLAAGGYVQSYELRCQLLPARGSVLSLSAFRCEVRNLIVDLEDPAWAPGQVGMLLAAGSLAGGEVEWERWLGHGLSAGVWVRYTDSREHASGQDLPHQPRWLGRLRVDYMYWKGNRLGVSWLHVRNARRTCPTRNDWTHTTYCRCARPASSTCTRTSS